MNTWTKEELETAKADGYLMAEVFKLRTENEQQKKELSRICNWIWNDDPDMESWNTDCGETFCLIEGGTQENHYLYCPKCGGHLIDSRELEKKK